MADPLRRFSPVAREVLHQGPVSAPESAGPEQRFGLEFSPGTGHLVRPGSAKSRPIRAATAGRKVRQSHEPLQRPILASF